MAEPLTEEQYEPIRSALFDSPPGQGATAAMQKIADNLEAAGLQLVSERHSRKHWYVVRGEGEQKGIVISFSDFDMHPHQALEHAQDWCDRVHGRIEVWEQSWYSGPATWTRVDDT